MIILRSTAAALATDAAVQKKIHDPWGPSDLQQGTTLIISNEEIEDIMKTVKAFQDSGLIIKGTSETIKNDTMLINLNLI